MLGEGIETDMIEALTWLIISAREGNKDASAYVGPVALFTTPTTGGRPQTSTVLAKARKKPNSGSN